MSLVFTFAAGAAAGGMAVWLLIKDRVLWDNDEAFRRGVRVGKEMVRGE